MKTYAEHKGVIRLEPCTYGLSRLSFRGPRRPTDGRFIAVLGGSDTFAKYIPKPFPDLVETAVGEVCVNLGCQGAGPDVYVQDTAVQALMHDAAATIIQVFGAINLSNEFYKVHPRRNDRFIRPTAKLTALFPEVDFAEISFTGHLISRLRDVDDARFALVRRALQRTWIVRMKQLIEQVSGPVILLWFASRAAAEDGQGLRPSHEPMFVTAEMVEALRTYVDDIIDVVGARDDTGGMSFAPLDTLAAQDALGVAAHVAAAKALRGPLMHGLN